MINLLPSIRMAPNQTSLLATHHHHHTINEDKFLSNDLKLRLSWEREKDNFEHGIFARSFYPDHSDQRTKLNAEGKGWKSTPYIIQTHTYIFFPGYGLHLIFNGSFQKEQDSFLGKTMSTLISGWKSPKDFLCKTRKKQYKKPKPKTYNLWF